MSEGEAIQLHRENVSGAKRPFMWRALVRTVRAECRIYQTLMSASSELSTTESPLGDTFTIRQSRFPIVTIVATFVGQRMIELRYAYRRSDEADTVRWEDRIGFAVDELDRVQFRHKGIALTDEAEAARLILTPILDPTFRPADAP